MNILIDSDALFALFVPGDGNQKRATDIFSKHFFQKNYFSLTNLVVQETATILSHKAGQAVSLSFLESYESLGARMVYLTREIEQEAWKLFSQQTTKGTSFIDCVNVVVYQKYEFDALFSFDRFYAKFAVKLLK